MEDSAFPESIPSKIKENQGREGSKLFFLKKIKKIS